MHAQWLRHGGDNMIHLEIRNRPPALNGKEIVHRNIECIAFEYNHMTNEIAIYEDYEQWVDQTPGYWIMFVVSVTYFDDNFKRSEKP